MPGGRPKPLYQHTNSAWWRRRQSQWSSRIPGKKKSRLVHRLDIGVLDHFLPLGDLRLDIGIKLLGRTAAVTGAGHADVGIALLGVIAGQRALRRGVELGDDGLGR